MDVEVSAGQGVSYRTRVFGHEAIEETKKLLSLNTTVWEGGSEVGRLSEVKGSACDGEVSALIHGRPMNIIVIRRDEKETRLAYWTALRKFGGYMPLECQGQYIMWPSRNEISQHYTVPGFAHPETGIEFSTDKGRFTLTADQMLACSHEQTKNGVNFLGGNWTEDTRWVSFIRS